MPGRKGKKTTPPQEVAEQADPQHEAFERLSDKLTATFAQGFDKLQQAIVDMASKTAAQVNDSQQQKRPADTQSSGYNTRNKDLRPLYNPEPAPPQKKSKKKPTKPAAAASRSEDAIEVDHTDVTIPQSNAQQPPVRHCADVNKNNNPGPSDLNLAMNDWVIGQATQSKTMPTPYHLPTSTATLPNDPSLEAQVQQVLLNTASHLAKGNQNTGFYPHRYIVRGLEQKKLGLNSLTVLEYLHGILRMIKDNAVPSVSKPYIYAHLEEIIEDAREYDWASAVRPWSEQVFTLINEGRLPEGWASQQKIQMLRMTMSRVSTAKLGSSNTQVYNTQNRPRQQKLTQTISRAVHHVLIITHNTDVNSSRAAQSMGEKWYIYVPFVCGTRQPHTPILNVIAATDNATIPGTIFKYWPGFSWPPLSTLYG